MLLPALVDQNGEATTATSSKYVLITLDGLVANGEYKLTVPADAFSDLATTANKSAEVTQTIVITDGQVSAPVAAPVVNSTAYATNQITVTFDKAVTASAIVPANYKLNNVSLPAGTEITLNASKTVATITLPAGFVKSDISAPVLSVSNVVSTDGGQLLPVTKTVTGGTILETVAPVLTKAEYTDADTIALYFDEETGLQATTGGKVEVYNGSTKVATADVASVLDATAGDDGKIKVTLTTTDVAPAVLATLNQATLTVKVAKDAILDTNGNTIAASTVTLSDLSANVSGTLTAGWNTTSKQFTTTLTTPAIEAGSTAYVYVVGDTDAPITTSNYANYRTVAIQSATSLSTGITFATTTDSFGSVLSNADYKVYVVVKDASGNVVDVQAAGADVTVSGL